MAKSYKDWRKQEYAQHLRLTNHAADERVHAASDDAARRFIRNDNLRDIEQAATGLCQSLPFRWARKIKAGVMALAGRGDDVRPAMQAIEGARATLGAVPVPLNAEDEQIQWVADRAASVCRDHVKFAGDGAMQPVPILQVCESPVTRAMRAYAACGRVCESLDVAMPLLSDGGLERLQCPVWWRRKLRTAQARRVEGAGRALGYVHAKGDVYVTREGLAARLAQHRRNRIATETARIESSSGVELSLSEAAELSVANKAIRRGELMVRLKGFEQCAAALGHRALFVVVTTPSEYHAYGAQYAGSGSSRRIVRTVANPAYGGHSPRDAMDYLQSVWARVRAALDRAGVQRYGFRTVEPHHDATPHENYLIFFPEWTEYEIAGCGHPLRFRTETIVREVWAGYALQRGGDEAGALKHRIKFTRITPESDGSGATAYVAKYISKNIDGRDNSGVSIGQDLTGLDMVTASMRVEAWAARWGIRQFQQFGGVPVGLWREARRVTEKQLNFEGDASPGERLLRRLWVAANKTASSGVDFAGFVMACGGVLARRAGLRVRLVKDAVQGVGRYGVQVVERVKGLAVSAIVPMTGVIDEVRVFTRLDRWRIRWGATAQKISDPWTRANNCTPATKTGWLEGHLLRYVPEKLRFDLDKGLVIEPKRWIEPVPEKSRPSFSLSMWLWRARAALEQGAREWREKLTGGLANA